MMSILENIPNNQTIQEKKQLIGRTWSRIRFISGGWRRSSISIISSVICSVICTVISSFVSSIIIRSIIRTIIIRIASIATWWSFITIVRSAVFISGVKSVNFTRFYNKNEMILFFYKTKL